jgi:acetyl esterase/lipase
MRRRGAWLACFAWLLLPCGAAGARQLDIPYGSDPAQTLDFYPGQGPGPHRLIVFFHGGGWTGGQKGVGRIIGYALNPAGYSVASVEYRLIPRTDIAGAMGDAAHAIAFLIAHAKEFDIDPAHFAVMGHSSGATMAALLGTDQSYLKQAGVDPHLLAAVVVLDGVFDLQANVEHFPSRQREQVFGTTEQGWRRFSPIVRMHEMQAHPRFCVAHEDSNPRFVEQEALFEAALKKQGEAVETVTAHGLTHGQLVREFDDQRQPMAGFAMACLKRAF